ncbi:ABC transporter substrate-binding protein [Thermococcus sp. Bubb.Bath]|uniref:ABC transporter substrate-binding protein n=1 Tax=Thermococcus sp. Bubb.Bath TaxID=1638242 RepID=UPI00143B3B63|nr:ABC transporter substrate-binding protein [Thermococcus sp. Bubb.Bath]NJF24353.1 DNA-binding protein [Thermococcus sp. Bubb.Bath]
MASKKMVLSVFIVFLMAFAVVASGCLGGGGSSSTTTSSPSATSSSSPSQSTTSSPSATSSPTTTTVSPTKVVQYVGDHLSNATVVETPNYVVIVGPEGSGAKVSNLPNKPAIVVSYKVNEKKTPTIQELMNESQGFGAINPAFLRDPNLDALIKVGREVTDIKIREAIYNALYIMANKEVPEIIIGDNKAARVSWNWVHDWYYNPVLAPRWDLVMEDKNAPSQAIGIGDYKNEPGTIVEATFGWPKSFDPAFDYETFGWAVYHNVGDTLVTYWKNETKEVSPDLAVAWAHNKNGTVWYFVIRGGVKAYDPKNNQLYPINATDVEFEFWRVLRAGYSVNWMLATYTNLSASYAMSENEFNKEAQNGLIAEYQGKEETVKSLNQLLQFFGYNGQTAGVYKLVLPHPYGGILSVLADPYLMVIPAKYMLGDKYEEAMKAADWGRKPDEWANYVQKGSDDPIHKMLQDNMIGVFTGPFYIKEGKENSYLVLERNPYYWNASIWSKLESENPGLVTTKRVIYVLSKDPQTRISLFQKGVADIAAVPLTRLNAVQNLKIGNFESRIDTVVTPDMVFVVLNAAKEPFNNELVREALAWATPYNKIYQAVYNGYMVPNYGPIPVGWLGYTTCCVNKYSFNLNKALQLLKQSGINPSDYSITIYYNSGNTERQDMATLLQNTWGQLGFKVTVTALSWPTLLQKTGSGDFQVYIVGWAPDFLDPDDYIGPFLQSAVVFDSLNYEVIS